MRLSLFKRIVEFNNNSFTIVMINFFKKSTFFLSLGFFAIGVIVLFYHRSWYLYLFFISIFFSVLGLVIDRNNIISNVKNIIFIKNKRDKPYKYLMLVILLLGLSLVLLTEFYKTLPSFVYFCYIVLFSLIGLVFYILKAKYKNK